MPPTEVISPTTEVASPAMDVIAPPAGLKIRCQDCAAIPGRILGVPLEVNESNTPPTIKQYDIRKTK
jgi:hypothetical protein